MAKGQPQPVASTLNSVDGRIKSNAAIVPAGAAGGNQRIRQQRTDIVLDINGYFVPATDPSGARLLSGQALPRGRYAEFKRPLGGPTIRRSRPELSRCSARPRAASPVPHRRTR